MQRQWDPITRLLHWTIMLSVTFQLFSSLFMASSATQFLFPVHEYVGVFASAAVLWFWKHSFDTHDWAILFPWNRAGLATVWAEMKGLLRFRLPGAGRQVGLSGFVHGLGVLALTGGAVTGVFISLILPGGHHVNPSDAQAFTSLSLLHVFFGKLIWVYWFGHTAFAVLHQMAGNRVFRGIFGFSSVSS